MLVEIDVISIDGPSNPKRAMLVDAHNRMVAAASRQGDWVFASSQGVASYSGEPVGIDLGAAVKAVEAPTVMPVRAEHTSDVEVATERALDRLEVLAESLGARLGRCAKASVYLPDPMGWPAMEKAWKRRFPDWKPARVVVPYATSPNKEASVEIAVKILADDSDLDMSKVETSDAPEPIGHEPQAVRAGQMVFLSGQVASDAKGELPAPLAPNEEFPFYGEQPRRQMAYMLENIAAICSTAGSSIANLCRRQAFHHDFTWFAQSMAEWGSSFDVGRQPASTTIEIGSPLLVPGAHVLLDLIAVAES